MTPTYELTNQSEIMARIDKNRAEIDSFLQSGLPLDLIYFNIRRLATMNERLIERLKSLNE